MSTTQEMEQVTVSELASEFEIKHTLVISELKKIGVWVPSADTQVDLDIANRIRRRLQLMAELELDAQAEKAKTAKSAKTTKKKATPAKARKSIKQLGKPRKTIKKTVEPEVESPLLNPLQADEERPTYRRIKKKRVKPVAEVVEDEHLTEKVVLPIDSVTGTDHPPEPVKIEKTPPKLPVAAEAAEKETEETPPTSEIAQDVEKTAEDAAKEAGAPPSDSSAPGPVAAKPAPEKVAMPQRPALPPRKLTPARVRHVRPPTRPIPAAVGRPKVKKPPPPVKPKAPRVFQPQELTLSETLTVKVFSEKTGIKSKDVLRELIAMGVMATINQSLDQSIMEKLCESFKVTPTFVTYEESVIEETMTEDKPEDLKPRSPVVTVMGHVDHGKTSLLDAIRNTRVASGEAGGITQHIGAYHVEVNEQRIVFLDTPGHEAFTMMRARGAQATDIVVLVVAADDGVMPQTREAIDHAKAAGVPLIVAINKIDKSDAQPDRVRQGLSDVGLVPEEWGGDTIMVEVSAIVKTNLDGLLEMIQLVAEVQELKANPDRLATGVVLEAKIDKGRGSVATVLVQTGTLNGGDFFIAGSISGKIRAMFDDRGKAVKKSGPATAVEVLGLQGLPDAGDTFQVVQDAARARQVVEYRKEKLAEQGRGKSARLSLDELYAKMQAGDIKELPVIVKADAQGSVEVNTDMLQKIVSEKVKVRVISSGVGAISESDVLLASASNAVIVGFNVRPEKSAQELAERESVDIRLHTVIYRLREEIEQALVGLLDPTFVEVFQGRAEVRETFKVPKFGIVAGSHVQDGTINRNSDVRLLRDNVVVFEGQIDSLRRFKEDVNSVRTGYECGISIAGYQDVKPGDIIEAFTQEQKKPELE